MQSIFLLFYIILAVGAISSKKFAFFVTVIHIPIMPLIHSDGSIPADYILTGIFFVHCIIEKINSRELRKNNFLLLLSLFAFLVGFLLFLNPYKYAIIKVGDVTSRLSYILNAFYLFALSYCIISISGHYMQSEEYRRMTRDAIISSSVILSLSVFFTPQLQSIGIVSPEINLESNRFYGLFSGGDSNGLAGLLSLIVLFQLLDIHIKRSNFKVIDALILLLNVSAILLTGSRMGLLLAIGIVVYFFVFLNKTNRIGNTVIILSLIAVVYFISGLWENVFNRMNDYRVSAEFDSQGDGRAAIWGIYLTSLFNLDTKSILFGCNHELYYLVPHNFYIYVFYLNGIIIAIMFLLMQLLFTKRSISYCTGKYAIPLAVVTVINLMFLTTGTLLWFYILMIAYFFYMHSQSECVEV